MNIHFRLTLHELAAFLNKRFEDVIFEGDLAESSAWASVRKYADITLDGEGDKIYVTVPLEVEAKLTLRQKFFGDMLNIIPKLEQTRFRITAHFTVRLFANDQWKLQSSTLGSFKWDEVPEVGLGPLKMKITTFLRPLIQTEIEEAAEIIDDSILEEVALQKRIQEAWKELQEPMQLHDDPPVWLEISSQATIGKREPLTVDHTCIDTAVFLPLTLALQLKRPTKLKPDPMPIFTQEASIDDLFLAKVQSSLDFQSLVTYYDNKTFQLPNNRGEIQVLNLSIEKQNEQLSVSFKAAGNVKYGFFKSKLEARVTVSLVPGLNGEARIQAETVSVDLRSSKFWIRSLNRLGKKLLASSISTLIKESLHDIDSQIRAELQATFAGLEISENIRLQGKLDSFSHTSLVLEQDGILVDSSLEGMLVFEILMP